MAPNPRTLESVHYEPGDYILALRLTNEDGGAETSTACTVTLTGTDQLPRGDRYVAAGNLNASGEFDSWAAAAPTIQDAVDAAERGEVIRIARGIYRAANPFFWEVV